MSRQRAIGRRGTSAEGDRTTARRAQGARGTVRAKAGGGVMIGRPGRWVEKDEWAVGNPTGADINTLYEEAKRALGGDPVINESGPINDAFISDDNGRDTTGRGSLSDARIIQEARAYIAKLTAEIFTLARERDEARRECDEVVAACRGTQMDEAAIASMWQYVREKVAIQAERDELRKRVAELESKTATGCADESRGMCEFLHHDKRDFHRLGDPCPAEARMRAYLHGAR